MLAHLSQRLKWGIATTIVSNRFLKRNFNMSNTKIKEKADMSLVIPTIEYASAVWHPYQQQHIYRLDMVQQRAAWYVTNRYHNTSSVSDMLEQLDWPPLQSHRTNSHLTLMHKMTSNRVKNTEAKLIQTMRRSNLWHNERAIQTPSCKTSTRKELFYPSRSGTLYI